MSPTPRKPKQDQPETEAVDAAAEVAPEAEPKPKPKRTRKAKPKAEATASSQAEGEAEGTGDPADEKTPAAKPKPRRSRRPAAPAPPPADAVAQESPRRASRPTAEGQRVAVRAQARYVRTSARKARLVCDHIRGKSVQEARSILLFTPRAVARDWSKLLESAVANAEHNHELIGDELRVGSVHADEGPTLKRFRPRAMGRATPIHKRTSHLTIELEPR